jgi:NADH-quinone oxidoreductase subunit L
MLRFFYLIPVLPFAGALINGLLGKRFRSERPVHGVACAAVGIALVLSIASVWQLATGIEAFADRIAEHPDPAVAGVDPEARRVELALLPWVSGGWEGSLVADWSLALDPLAAVMILVVTGVGFLIHLYSIGYMHGDPGYARYFAYLNLFTGMMLVLVLGASFPVLFVGWEGVGLCSYLLIGFWYEDLDKASAGMKAFLVNRIGDLGFLLGLLLIVFVYGTLDIQSFLDQAAGAPVALTAIGVLLFIGAIGKSAQIPLHVWLPDAMAGPTPVSALIHAATMVTAGVYMVARTSGLFLNAPGALAAVAVIGGCTALFAATIATAQTDVKKVLAYSTVSQLGTMFLGCGVGAFAAGIFHLTTHAFFKALLFLGAGSVIHALSGSQEMLGMGGLRRRLPSTSRTMLVGALAIAGIPPLAGFFSKDEILARAWEDGHVLLWLLGSAAALLTSFYVFRLIYLIFAGEPRMGDDAARRVHESPPVMTAPLWILAALSAAGGLIGIPAALSFGRDWNLLERWLAPVFGSGREGVEAAGHHGGGYLPMAAAVGVALAGWLVARAFYGGGLERARRAAARLAPLRRVLANKYYVDELYAALFVRPAVRLSGALDGFDRAVVDGTVNGSGAGVQIAGQVVKLFQTGHVRNYALSFLLGVVFILWYLLAG